LKNLPETQPAPVGWASQTHIDSVRERFNKNLLGRLRLKLFEEISAGPEIPSATDQRHFVLATYRSNPEIGNVFQDLLALQRLHQVQYGDIATPKNVLDLLVRLEEEPLDSSEFVEVQSIPSSSESFGVLIQRHGLKPSGYVYAVTVIGESCFPDAVLGRLEVRACKELPTPPFSMLTDDGFQTFEVDEVSNEWLVQLTAAVLSHVAKVTGLQTVNLDRIEDPATSPLRPPEDPYLLQLILDAHDGKVECAKANIRTDMVKPHSYEFCLRFPAELIRIWADRLIRRPSPHIRVLVYWDGESFIMSDDYCVYLAFRRLDRKEIPAVIIGDLPDFVTPTEIGGAELLPPPGIVRIPDTPNARREDLDQLVEEHVKESRGDLNPLISHLYAVSIALSQIIHDPNVKEADIHNFLAKNPVAIDPAGFGIQSEVRLGNKYRVDLLVHYPNADRQILLIELESADKQLFTKNGRPRAHVTHAIQQVEDWLRWWRENPRQVPDGLDSSLVPSGLVVIGKARDLGDEDHRRLVHLNANRNVKVVTYDDLLKKIDGLIRQLEKILD